MSSRLVVIAFALLVVETEAAVKAGNDVKAEVRAFARTAATKGLARS